MESKSLGFAALDSAKALIDSLPGGTLKRPVSKIDAGEEWFRINQRSVEQLIREQITLRKHQPRHIKVVPQRIAEPTPMDDLDSYADSCQVDFDGYRPPIDDGGEEYIPMSER